MESERHIVHNTSHRKYVLTAVYCPVESGATQAEAASKEKDDWVQLQPHFHYCKGEYFATKLSDAVRVDT